MKHIIRLVIFYLLCNPAMAEEGLRAIKYEFSLQGLNSPSIEKRFNASSHLLTFKDTPLYSRQILNKRICDDYDALVQLLESKGFYDAVVTVQIQDRPTVMVDFRVEMGQRYRLRTITIDLGGAKEELLAAYPFLFELLPIQVGQNVSAEKVHETFDILLKKLGHCGYPYAKIKHHQVELVPDAKRIILTIDVEPGPKVLFGPVTVAQNRDVPGTYIINRAPWNQGEVFDSRKIERYQEKLARTRLFDGVTVDYPEAFDGAEEVPLIVNVNERRPRTLSAGVNYSLNDGIGGTVSWTHRNVSSQADRLRSAISYGQIESKFEVDYALPDFIWPRTTLAPSFAVTHQDTESYTSNSVGTAMMLRNEFAENSEYYYGVTFDYDRAKQEGEIKVGKLVGLPIGIKYDTRDDLFDPTKGYAMNLTFSPRIGKIGEANFMTRTIFLGSVYHEMMANTVLASWCRLGSIGGIHLRDVVANQRLYSGGGGSVRGYGYQMLGPLDLAGDPTGGKSLVEGGFELRAHILEDWGVVLFVEGGYVGHHTTPVFDNDVLFGAGAGIRYYTDFGPIRADIAAPLKRRKKLSGGYVDDAIQFYISIGQGF